MQRPDDKKRRDILKVAERLFATKPFHEVKLDDVASKCRIGKGTIYIYFKSKEDLYVSLLREGMTELVSDLRRQLADSRRTSMGDLLLILTATVQFSAERPGMYQLMRMVLPKACEHELHQLRGEMVELVRQTIERGIKSGEMTDPRPELTAHYLVSSVRGGLLFGPRVDADEMARHMLHVFGMGLKCRKRR